jgi:hypothetical protein
VQDSTLTSAQENTINSKTHVKVKMRNRSQNEYEKFTFIESKHNIKLSMLLSQQNVFRYISQQPQIWLGAFSEFVLQDPGNFFARSFDSFFTCHIWNMREVLVSWWEKWKIFIADFHVLGLFMAKNHDLSDEKNSVCHAPLTLPLPLPSPSPSPYVKFVPRLQPRP